MSSSDDLLLEIHHLLNRARPQSQYALDLEATLHFRLHAVATAHHALVGLEAARSHLQSEASAVSLLSQSLAPNAQLSLRQSSVTSRAVGTLSSSSALRRTPTSADGQKGVDGSSIVGSPPKLSEKAKGKLKESASRFATTYGEVMDRFESAWDTSMAGATEWRKEAIPSSSTNDHRGASASRTRQREGKGSSGTQSLHRSEVRPLRTWFSGHGPHALSPRSAETCLRVLRVALNQLSRAAQCLAELDTEALSLLLQPSLELTTAITSAHSGATGLDALMGIIAATTGAEGVLRFTEDVFLHVASSSEGKGEGVAVPNADQERLLLAMLSALEALDMNVRWGDHNRGQPCKHSYSGLFSPSSTLELELLDYLKQARRDAAQSRRPSFPHFTSAMQNGDNSRGPPTSAFSALPGRIPLPSLGTLNSFGTNAADFWNASMAGGMATISGLWAAASADIESASQAAAGSTGGSTEHARVRTKSLGSKGLGTSPKAPVPASLSLSRFVSTPPPPSTSPTRNRAVAELSSPSRIGSDLASHLQSSTTSAAADTASAPIPISNPRVAFPLSDVMEDEGSSSPTPAAPAASNEAHRRRPRLTSLTSALGFFDQRGRSERTRALSDAAATKSSIRVVRGQRGDSEASSSMRPDSERRKNNQRDTSQPPMSPARNAAARIAWVLLGVDPEHADSRSFRSASLSGSTSLPLPLALSRRLLAQRFPPGSPHHRRIALLLIVRWFSFNLLGGLIMTPEACGKGLQGGLASWGRNALRLPIPAASSADNGTSSASEVRKPERMMHDVWLADADSSQALGELHRELYRAIVRAAGFGPNASSTSKVQGEEKLPRSRSSTPMPPKLDSLDRAALALVEAFGISTVYPSEQGEDGKRKSSSTPSTAEHSEGMVTFALHPAQLSAMTRVWTSLVSGANESTWAEKLEGLPASDDTDVMVSGSATPRPLGVSLEDVAEAATELQGAVNGTKQEDASQHLVLLFAAVRPGDGKVLLEQTAGGIMRQCDKLAPARVPPSSGSVDYESNVRPIISATSLARTGSSMTNGTFVSSVPSSSDEYGTSARSRDDGSSVGWGSPPISPYDEQAQMEDPGQGFFHSDSQRQRTSAIGHDADYNGAFTSPTIASCIMAHSPQHGRDTTITMKAVSAQSSRPSRQLAPIDASSRIRSQEDQVNSCLRQANLPLAEIKRGILLLLRREAPRWREAHGGSSLPEALGSAAASSRASFDFDAARLFQRTAKWLQHIAIAYPVLAYDADTSALLPSSAPSYSPLLRHFRRPLYDTEVAQFSRIRRLQNALADVEVHRLGMIDRARILIARVHELRARVWFASSVRCAPEVMAACHGAARGLEVALEQPSSADTAGETAGTAEQSQTSPKTWMRNLGIYDFSIGSALEAYFQDLDPAFNFIACDAKDFFASSLWSREAALARPFLSMSPDGISGNSSEPNLSASDRIAMLPSGVMHVSLLHPGETRVHTLVGLENFLQRVQLLSTGLLLSEALAGVPSAPTDTWLASRLDEAARPMATRVGPTSSRFALQNNSLASALSKSGARQLLRRFELQPSPHHKMRALLTLERLVITELSAPHIPLAVSARQPWSPLTASHANDPGSSAQEQLEAARKDVRRREASVQPATAMTDAPPLALGGEQRPGIVRQNSAVSTSSARTRAGTGMSAMSASGRSAQPDSHRPLSMRVSSANAGRRALSMYEDKADENQRGSGLGLLGLNTGGPSIHELLSGLSTDLEDDADQPLPGLRIASLQPIDTSDTVVATASPTSTRPSPISAGTEGLVLSSIGIPFPTGGDSTSSDYSRSGSSISSRTFDAGEADSQSRWAHVSENSVGGRSADSGDAQEDDDDPPNTDMVVNALESILLDPTCRPADLVCTLQLICAFSPTCVIDLKDEGKAMWDLALASLSLRREAAMSELQSARDTMAAQAGNGKQALILEKQGQVRAALRRGEQEGALLTPEERELAYGD